MRLVDGFADGRSVPFTQALSDIAVFRMACNDILR